MSKKEGAWFKVPRNRRWIALHRESVWLCLPASSWVALPGECSIKTSAYPVCQLREEYGLSRLLLCRSPCSSA